METQLEVGLTLEWAARGLFLISQQKCCQGRKAHSISDYSHAEAVKVASPSTLLLWVLEPKCDCLLHVFFQLAIQIQHIQKETTLPNPFFSSSLPHLSKRPHHLHNFQSEKPRSHCRFSTLFTFCVDSFINSCCFYNSVSHRSLHFSPPPLPWSLLLLLPLFSLIWVTATAPIPSPSDQPFHTPISYLQDLQKCLVKIQL